MSVIFAESLARVGVGIGRENIAHGVFGSVVGTLGVMYIA